MSRHNKWQQLSHAIDYQCPYFRIGHDEYVMPNQHTGNYYYLHINASVFVVPLLADGRIVLVQQHRYLFGRPSLEFPGGGMGTDTDPQRAAQRELHEEAGYEAKQWHALGQFAPCNGLSNEMCHVFLAQDLVEVGQQPDESEELSVVRATPKKVSELISSGTLWDGMTLATLSLLQLHKPDLWHG